MHPYLGGYLRQKSNRRGFNGVVSRRSQIILYYDVNAMFPGARKRDQKRKQKPKVELTAEQEREYLLSQLRPCEVYYALRPKSVESQQYITYKPLGCEEHQNICEIQKNSHSNSMPCIESQ